MKKILSLLAVLLLSIGMVSAFPVGQWTHKTVEVWGQWEWQDDHWDDGIYKTAHYEADMWSADALSGFFEQDSTLGDYEYKTRDHWGANADAITTNEMHSWTVNPPETTPGELHTFVQYRQDDFSEYSTSQTQFNSNGVFDYSSTVRYEGYGMQDIWVDVNP